MNAPAIACADQILALNAYADGECDALTAAALERHLHTCAGCTAELARIRSLGARLHAEPRERAPASIQQLAARLGRSRRSPPAPRRAFAGGVVLGALAASLTLWMAPAGLDDQAVIGGIVDGQIRSLQAGHLVDIPTSDRHTVKPWFNGRIAFAPPVVDLKDRGFALVGGRLDVVDATPVAVLVFQRRAHVINLYVRPAPGLSVPWTRHAHKMGYNLIGWVSNGLAFWAVSDVDAADLTTFAAQFRAAT